MKWTKVSHYDKKPKKLVVKDRDGNLVAYLHTGTDMSQISLTDQYEYYLDEYSAEEVDVDALAKKKYAELFLVAGMTALHDDDGLDDFIVAFKAGYAASEGEEAIGFAEWIIDNDYSKCHDGTWIPLSSGYTDTPLTITELFNLYKQSKK